ncbi:MAG: 1-(5-phosphoribosyl)-5-amino-4-imidazole-carboxylate carboxylase [Planctomycetales bacterium 4484_123]|nr:MAG: 1-(5-phosphoribosyl)-5-amino-4-imidazole-carboxylate carboxylase [Planctomycetales bacterium 4484_123]
MDERALRSLLESVRNGATEVDEAIARLRRLPFERLGFATVDHHRAIRCGFPEVIFSPGKSPEQVAMIFAKLAEQGGNVLATRAGPETFQAVRAACPEAEYHASARAITLRQGQVQLVGGRVALVAAGTSDLPVAEEARVTAEIMAQRVVKHYDVGVAGIHRLLDALEDLHQADVVIVVAGMEGALASVVGGLVSVPVIGVPTSVGYGASFGGLSALLTMLNSCAAGVVVVNIDNGFAAGYAAALIAGRSARRRAEGQA